MPPRACPFRVEPDGGAVGAGAAWRGALSAAAVFLLVSGGGAVALENIGGAPNAAYLAAVHGLGLQAEIIYLPPAADFDLDEKPAETPPESARPPDFETQRWVLIALAGAVLVLLAGLVIRNSSSAGAIFSRPLSEGARRTRSSAPQAASEPASQPGSRVLAELAGLGDRRQALQRLTELSLDYATRANGIRLGRSQTARDVVRLLPAGSRHVAALKLIVRTEEAVRFAGGPLPDALFADCLTAIRPLFADNGEP